MAAAVRILRAAWSLAVLCACAVPCVAGGPAEPPVSPSADSRPAAVAQSLPQPEALPDAPVPNRQHGPAAANSQPLFAALSLSSPASPSAATGGLPAQGFTRPELDAACQLGALRGKPCRASWLPILWESLEATAVENSGNIALDSDTRNALTTNPYWATYARCVHQFRYRQWRDDDGFGVDYLGHGLQGAWVASLFEQHDPTGRGLVYADNANYWRSRLKAMAWIAVYEVQWKIGPAGEASVGNSGLNTYFTPRVQGRSTNETGFQDFVDTPIVGFWWNVGEDALDRFLMPHIWKRTHNRLILTALFPLTPCKAAANILRYKPFYYRDFPLTPLR